MRVEKELAKILNDAAEKAAIRPPWKRSTDPIGEQGKSKYIPNTWEPAKVDEVPDAKPGKGDKL